MRNYHFLSRYPDKDYQHKFIRIAKTWAWGLLIVMVAILIWAGLGAPVSHGGKKENLQEKFRIITTCVKNADALTWRPSTDPSYISHYLVYASIRARKLETSQRLEKLQPIGTTKAMEFKLVSEYRKRVYFFTVQAVGFNGLKSKPAKAVSCFNNN